MKPATSSKRPPVPNPSRAVPCNAWNLAPDSVSSTCTGIAFRQPLASLQTLFTGTIAKVESLIAIVIGGYACQEGQRLSVGLARLVFRELDQSLGPFGASHRVGCL